VAERFFSPDRPIDGRIRLQGDEAHHLSRVRRLGPGDDVEVFDGEGYATRARIARVAREGVDLEVIGDPLPDRESGCRLTLATAVPKGDRFDWLVEKATELGVERLVPILTERSSVDPRATKIARLQRVIVEAAKQCGRNRLMVLSQPRPWSDWMRKASASGPRLLAHPCDGTGSHWPRLRNGDAVTLAIGPEGGFSPDEVEAAGGAGWRIVSLGMTLLRIETAGLVGCATLLALCDHESQVQRPPDLS
jgi:16S rRNA (uracil1498-N3)-methyltransferase